MKFLSFFLIAIAAILTDPMLVRKINRIKTDARDAYNSGDYKTAVEKYKYLTDSLRVNEEEVLLNLANAYYHLQDTANATSTYQRLTGSDKRDIRSKAYQQLGVIANQQGKPEQALADFKNALKADPENEQARYNYEMVKKKQGEQNDQDQKKKDQNKKDDKKKDEPSEFARKLKAQADQLVGQRRYSEAYNLLVEGMSKDPTVQHYADYMQRIKDIVEINK